MHPYIYRPLCCALLSSYLQVELNRLSTSLFLVNNSRPLLHYNPLHSEHCDPFPPPYQTISRLLPTRYLQVFLPYFSLLVVTPSQLPNLGPTFIHCVAPRVAPLKRHSASYTRYTTLVVVFLILGLRWCRQFHLCPTHLTMISHLFHHILHWYSPSQSLVRWLWPNHCIHTTSPHSSLIA